MHHSLFLLSLIQFRLLAVMNTNIDYSSDRFKLSNLENLQILKVRFLFVVVCFSSVLTVHPLGTRPESFEDVQSGTDVQSETDVQCETGQVQWRRYMTPGEIVIVMEPITCNNCIFYFYKMYIANLNTSFYRKISSFFMTGQEFWYSLIGADVREMIAGQRKTLFLGEGKLRFVHVHFSVFIQSAMDTCCIMTRVSLVICIA